MAKDADVRRVFDKGFEIACDAPRGAPIGEHSDAQADVRISATRREHPAVARWHRLEIEARDAAGLEEATNRAAAALAQRFGEGAIEGRIRAFVITASR